MLSFTVTSESIFRSVGRVDSCSGSSVGVRKGLSSIGGIFKSEDAEAMELR